MTSGWDATRRDGTQRIYCEPALTPIVWVWLNIEWVWFWSLLEGFCVGSVRRGVTVDGRWSELRGDHFSEVRNTLVL